MKILKWAGIKIYNLTHIFRRKETDLREYLEKPRDDLDVVSRMRMLKRLENIKIFSFLEKWAWRIFPIFIISNMIWGIGWGCDWNVENITCFKDLLDCYINFTYAAMDKIILFSKQYNIVDVSPDTTIGSFLEFLLCIVFNIYNVYRHIVLLLVKGVVLICVILSILATAVGKNWGVFGNEDN